MKVTSTSSVSASSGSSGTKAAAEGFRLDMDGAGPAARPAVGGLAGAGGVSGVSTLLALQGLGGLAGQARERALRKGRRLLDALDRLQLSMLADGPTRGHLDLLNRALQEQRDPSGDVELDETLNWAEVRVAVEAAKLSRAA